VWNVTDVLRKVGDASYISYTQHMVAVDLTSYMSYIGEHSYIGPSFLELKKKVFGCSALKHEVTQGKHTKFHGMELVQQQH